MVGNRHQKEHQNLNLNKLNKNNQKGKWKKLVMRVTQKMWTMRYKHGKRNSGTHKMI